METRHRGDPKKKLPAALVVSAALGDVGGTAIGHKVQRDLPYRAFRDMTRQRAEPNEGSDAIFHATRDPRWVEVQGPGLRVRPPFLGDSPVAAVSSPSFTCE